MNAPIRRKADASFFVAMAALLLVVQAFLLPMIGLGLLILTMSDSRPSGGMRLGFLRYFAPTIIGAPVALAGVILAVFQKRPAALVLAIPIFGVYAFLVLIFFRIVTP